jgi:hypothetical protein
MENRLAVIYFHKKENSHKAHGEARLAGKQDFGTRSLQHIHSNRVVNVTA